MPIHESDVKVLRSTGIINKLFDELETRKSGARAIAQSSIDAHSFAIQNGTGAPTPCYQPHHLCRGAVIVGQFSQHQISPSCGHAFVARAVPVGL
jgi:hypothetical protein